KYIFNFVRQHNINNLDLRVSIPDTECSKDSDEITEIANSLNKMQAHLSNSLSELLSLKTTLDLTLDAIFMFYPDDEHFFYSNNGASNMLGYNLNELSIMSPQDICPELDQEFLQEFIDRSQNKHNHEQLDQFIELDFICKNGDVIPVELTLQYLSQDKDHPRFVFIARDISKRKKIELELRESTIQANVANEAKTKFVSSMSHELRTPLNAILGFTQLLKLDSDQLTPSQTESIDDIYSAAQHLFSLIEEILNFAKIESGDLALSLENVCLDEVIDECINLIIPLRETKKVQIDNSLSNQTLPIVLVDKMRLKQVLINLLSNALKYNKVNGSVTISGQLIKPDLYRLIVADTGEGISESEKEKIFLPFTRLGYENTETTGVGIGLNISQKLIRVMNGDIDFESTPGVGTRFWIDLPVATSVTNI
ncbi:MAG: PAS domain-containing sensor histidine kinase, partial [Gammaproteobacteria bacterium]|nr:PAS domain-containing sensor histidine kinase [Gammaproteobacteria bacterium]